MHSDGDRTAWLEGGDARCQNPGPLPRRPWHLVLLGPPGVGKGTQAARIVAEFGACHLSTGDVFRTANQHCNGFASPALTSAVAIMKQGGLVPDETVVSLVRERIGCLHCHHGFILDGFPRTLDQARALDGMLAEVGTRLDHVILLDTDERTIVQRLSGRRICGRCRASWHLISHPPRETDVCDDCGGALIQRDDDRPETIRVRLKAYRTTADPLIAHYRAAGVLHEIDAGKPPARIFDQIRARLVDASRRRT